MEALIIAVFGIIVFTATMLGAYCGSALAARTIQNAWRSGDEDLEDMEEEIHSSRIRRREIDEESYPDDRVVRKRQGTDDSYRILKRRRSKQEEQT